jgi:hypothetical protein
MAPAIEDIVIAAIRHGIVIGDFFGGRDVAHRHERVGTTDAAIRIARMVDVVRSPRSVRDQELVFANLRAITIAGLRPIQIDLRRGRNESIPNSDNFTGSYHRCRKQALTIDGGSSKVQRWVLKLHE